MDISQITQDKISFFNEIYSKDDVNVKDVFSEYVKRFTESVTSFYDKVEFFLNDLQNYCIVEKKQFIKFSILYNMFATLEANQVN